MRAQPHRHRLKRHPHLRLVHSRRRRRSRPSGRNLGRAACFLVALTVAFWPGLGARLLGPPAATIEGVARMIDGDTLEIAGQRIRLHGIDAPERDQACRDADGRTWSCGRQATQELQALAERRVTACYGQDVDRYGRLVARCEVGGRDLASEIARRGLAVAYLRYSWAYVLPQIEPGRMRAASGPATSRRPRRGAASAAEPRRRTQRAQKGTQRWRSQSANASSLRSPADRA